jgi:hypothetical protein
MLCQPSQHLHTWQRDHASFSSIVICVLCQPSRVRKCHRLLSIHLLHYSVPNGTMLHLPPLSFICCVNHPAAANVSFYKSTLPLTFLCPLACIIPPPSSTRIRPPLRASNNRHSIDIHHRSKLEPHVHRPQPQVDYHYVAIFQLTSPIILCSHCFFISSQNSVRDPPIY